MPQSATLQALSDLRSPTFAGETPSLVPTERSPIFGHATAWTVTVAFSEEVFGAGGATLSGDDFALSVNNNGMVANINDTFVISLSPSPPSMPPSAPPLPPSPQPAFPTRRALQGAAQVAVGATNAGATSIVLSLMLASSDELPSGNEEVTIATKPGITDAAGNALAPATISLGKLEAPGTQYPASPPAPPPVNSTGGVSPETIAIVASISGGLILLIVLLICCAFLCFGGTIRRWLVERQAKRDRKALEAVKEFIAGNGDDDKELAARKLRTLKDVLGTASRKRLVLSQAADVVLNGSSVLPPQLSSSLATEYAKIHGPGTVRLQPRAAWPLLPHTSLGDDLAHLSFLCQLTPFLLRIVAGTFPSDEQKLELLEELLRPPPLPPLLLQQARAHYQERHGVSPDSDEAALLLMKEVLDPFVASAATLQDDDDDDVNGAGVDLRTAVEEEKPVLPGPRGGGGARARPPHLKPVAELKPLPAPPPGLDASSLPVGVLAASAAMFGHNAAPLVTAEREVKVADDLRALRQRLDQIIGPPRGDGRGPPILHETDEGAHIGSLPPAVLEAARGLFNARLGVAPSNDREALEMLRDALRHAGVSPAGAKTELEQVLEAMPPPPPSVVHVNELPASVLRMASRLEEVNPHAPEEVKQQQQLLALRKRVDDFLHLKKLPKLVQSMARSDFEADNGRGAKTDVEAINHLLDKLAAAGMSEVVTGWDGGGGAGPVRPPLLGASAGKSVELPPPPPQVDMRKVPAAAVNAASALGLEVSRLHQQDQLAVLIGRLREHRRQMLPPDALREAHEEYTLTHGRAAASDREALASLGSMIEAAKATDVKAGWEAGGGVRVLPPKPRPPLASSITGKAYAPERPLQLGAVPLSVIRAAQATNRKSNKGLLQAVFGGLTGSAGGPDTDGASQVQTDPAQLAAQLAKLRQRLDGALTRDAEGRVDAEKVHQLPQAVREAARQAFVGRRGAAPSSEVEALKVLRDMLDEAGMRRDVVDATYGRTSGIGSGKRLTFARFALPPPGGEDSSGLRLELVSQERIRVGGDVSHVTTLASLPSRVKRAAVELDAVDGRVGAVSNAFGYEAAGGDLMATPAQLRQLRDQIDAHIGGGGPGASGNGWGAGDGVRPLPASVELALQAEFHTRLGGDDVGERGELLLLAKQVMQEAKQARERATAHVDLDGHRRDHMNGSHRSLFGEHGGSTKALDAWASGGASRMLTRQPSRRCSKRLVRMPSFANAGEGGFLSHVERADSERELGRGYDKASMLEAETGGCKRSLLVEHEDLAVHHLGSRKQLYGGAVHTAVGALAKSGKLQATVQAAEDAPSLLRQISARLDAPPRARIGQQLMGAGQQLATGMQNAAAIGMRLFRGGGGGAQVQPSTEEAEVKDSKPGRRRSSSSSSAALIPPSQSNKRVRPLAELPVTSGWDGGGGVRLPVLTLAVARSERGSTLPTGRETFVGAAQIHARRPSQISHSVSGPDAPPPAPLPAPSRATSSNKVLPVLFSSETTAVRDYSGPQPPPFGRQCSTTSSMRRLPPLPPLQRMLTGGFAAATEFPQTSSRLCFPPAPPPPLQSSQMPRMLSQQHSQGQPVLPPVMMRRQTSVEQGFLQPPPPPPPACFQAMQRQFSSRHQLQEQQSFASQVPAASQAQALVLESVLRPELEPKPSLAPASDPAVQLQRSGAAGGKRRSSATASTSGPTARTASLPSDFGASRKVAPTPRSKAEAAAQRPPRKPGLPQAARKASTRGR